MALHLNGAESEQKGFCYSERGGKKAVIVIVHYCARCKARLEHPGGAAVWAGGVLAAL